MTFVRQIVLLERVNWIWLQQQMRRCIFFTFSRSKSLLMSKQIGLRSVMKIAAFTISTVIKHPCLVSTSKRTFRILWDGSCPHDNINPAIKIAVTKLAENKGIMFAFPASVVSIVTEQTPALHGSEHGNYSVWFLCGAHVSLSMTRVRGSLAVQEMNILRNPRQSKPIANISYSNHMLSRLKACYCYLFHPILQPIRLQHLHGGVNLCIRVVFVQIIITQMHVSPRLKSVA